MSNKEQSILKFRWVSKPGQFGEMLFTLDGERIFNLFQDYPHALTKEEKQMFDEENPFWVDFFSDDEQTYKAN